MNETAPATAPARPLRKGDHVFLIDGSSYVFRAYFAMFKAAQARGRSFTRSDGLPIGGVLTFSNMLWKLLREGLNGVKPTHVAVVFDHSAKSFRNEIYSDYKGHRPDPPDELIPQFPLMRDAVRAFGLIPIEQEGFEADDLIATYARVALEAGADATIVAGDKDLMQLIRPGIMMFDPMPGNERRVDEAYVIEKFGVPPAKVPEVQALIGDPTDNVPGVPGIGVKTAAQLIGEYGDLETLLARAREIKQEKRRQSLIEFAEQARLSRRLVQLDDRVALECPLDRLCLDGAACLEGGDARQLMAFLKAMEFASLIKRVAEATGVDPNEIEADPRLRPDTSLFPAPEIEPASPPPLAGEPPSTRIEPAATLAGMGLAAFTFPWPLPDPRPQAEEGVRHRKAADAASARDGSRRRGSRSTGRSVEIRDRERSRGARRLDRQRHGPRRGRGRPRHHLARSDDRRDHRRLARARAQRSLLRAAQPSRRQRPLGGRRPRAGQVPAREALAKLKPLLEDRGVLKLGHDLKADLLVLARNDIALVSFDDVLLMSYVLDAGRGGHAIDKLAKRHLDHTAVNLAEVVGKGRTLVPFETIEIVRACPYCAEIPDLVLRLWHVLKARLVAESNEHGLPDAGAAAGARAGAHGALRRHHRPADPVAALRRVRPDHGAAGGRDRRARRRALQPWQPEAARRHSVRQDGPAGRHQDADRRLVDPRQRARRPGRAGARAAGKDPGMAPGLEAQIDLHRRSALLRQSRHRPRAHELRARRHHDRPAVLVGAEPAEHPDQARGRAQDPQGLHRGARLQARLRRLFADRAPAAGRDRRRAGAAPARSRRAPTSMR